MAPTNLATSSYAPAAAPQPNNQSSFGPIRSEVSPVRQRKTSPFQAAQLDVSQAFNPVGVSQSVAPQQVRVSRNVDKSLHLESLLGAPGAGDLGTIQTHSLIMSTENCVPEGASRLQMLH